MDEKLNSKPTSEDAIEFQEAVDSGMAKKKLLFGAMFNYDSDVRDKASKLKFFLWLSSQRKFIKVIQYLSIKGLTENFPDRAKIEIAKCVASVYEEYCFFSSWPRALKGTTKATKSKAIDSAKSLLCLFEKDLQMESFLDIIELKRLLRKLKSELSGDIPVTYPRTKRSDLLGYIRVSQP
jgi:hypothetical protein